MTKERTVKLVLGDWSGDGHSVTETIILRIRGENVSDEALKNAREQAEKLTGVKIDRLFTSDAVPYLEGVAVKRILLEGIPAFEINGEPSNVVEGPGFYVSEANLQELKADPELASYAKQLAYIEEAGEYEGLNVITFLMAYLSYGIEDFDYEQIKIDTIVGTYGAPLSGFGYGIFGP